MIPGITSAKTAGFAFTARTVTYIEHSYYDSENNDDYTFNSMNLGTPSSARWIAIGLHIYDADLDASISSITINGYSARIVIQTTVDTLHMCLALAHVPAGTTGNVVVSMTNEVSQMLASLWEVTGIVSYHAYDSDSNADSNPNVTLDTLADGYIIAIGSAEETFGDISATWTGATERFDINDANYGYTGADVATSAGTLEITVNYSGFFNDEAILAMSI